MKNSQQNIGWCLPVVGRYRFGFILGALLMLCAILSLSLSSNASALTTVPTKMNFQGRLTDSAGNIKPNGTYNMKLRLYTVNSGGSAVWTEDRLVSASQGVTVTNGLFSIKLGDVTSLPANLFASGGLYLEVELPTPATATGSSPSWTEGAMTPRNQMATSAYAYNAETLDGVDSTSFARVDAQNNFQDDQFFTYLEASDGAYFGNVTSVYAASTNAFNIYGPSGTLFTADTTNRRVGIGTASPGQLLHLASQGSSDAAILLQTGAATTVSTREGATAYENDWGASPWANIGGAIYEDSDPATSFLDTSDGDPSNDATNQLIVKGYGHTVPNDATIVGIEVWIGGVLAADGVDVGLTSNGTSTSGNTYSGQATDGTFGGPTDLWGGTWTPAMVNSANFGAGVSFTVGGSGVTAPVEIDTIQTIVYYTRSSAYTLGADYSDNGVFKISNTTALGTSDLLRLDGQTGSFSIQSPSNSQLFSVSSSGGVQIGVNDATATALVLDSKNTGGDPTGVNGAMYYNSSTARFRCYQASTWKNCDDGGNATTVDGLDSTAFGQLSANNTWTGANTINVLGANAFDIQNGSSVSVLKVDTVNQIVSLGNSTNANNARLSVEGTGGVTWIARTAAEANNWLTVTYGNGLFVAVSSTGTNRVMTSPNGITWTARTAAQANDWRSVTYGNGLFVAVSQDGTNRVMTSPDGITWTARTAAQANSWRSVTYGNGQFVAVSDFGTNRVMTSPDGITWTARTAAQANEWQSVTYGNGLFVAVSTTGTSRVMTSPDGITWTARTAAQANLWESVTYGNGLFVAVSQDGTNRVMTSPDGITWTARTAAQANGWNTITYGNGLFVAVSWSGTNRVMTSPDGITWTARTAAEANSWDAVTYGNGQFVAVSTTGTNRVMTSSDVALDVQGQVQINGDFSVGSGLFSVDTGGAGTVTILGNATGGKTEPWSTAANVLPSGRSYATSVAANGYVYMIGGFNGSYQSTVYYAKLNADGSVGTWSTAANALPATRSDATSVVANGYVYVMGGYDGTYHDTVYYAKLNADGSVGTWRTSTNVLPGLRNNATSVVANGYVYVMGGFDGSVRTNTVYYAKLNADGSIGTWSTAANTLPAVRSTATSVTANGYVYVMGGRDDSTTHSTVYYAKLNADGTVGTWSTAANALPGTRNDSTSIVVNGYVYVMGGTNGPTHSTVYYAKLNADGSIGTWATGANSLPATRYGATSVVANGYAYVIGGVNTGNHDTVYYSRVGGVVNVGGSLDLVGLQGQNLADGGDGSTGSMGGSITAGNITGVGTLQIQGAAAFANTASVAGDFNAGNGLFSVETGNSAVRIGSSISDATGVVLILDTKNTAGDPTGVAGAMYYNSSMGRFRCYQGAAWRDCLNTVVANTTVPAGNTVANTVTATDFASGATITAGTCTAGKVYHITARGVYGTTTTAPNLRLQLVTTSTSGTIQLATTGSNATTVSMTNQQWTMEADVICNTAPSTTATTEAAGLATRATGATDGVTWSMANTGPVTWDTTLAQTLKIRVTWSVANAANTITLRQFIMEEKNP